VAGGEAGDHVENFLVTVQAPDDAVEQRAGLGHRSAIGVGRRQLLLLGGVGAGSVLVPQSAASVSFNRRVVSTLRAHFTAVESTTSKSSSHRGCGGRTRRSALR